MLYQALKPLVVDAGKRFFRNVYVRGTPVESGPLLICANHVNVVLDGLLVLALYDRTLWFTVKGAIFRGPVIAAILDWLKLTPVYRRKDNPDDTSKNEGAFRQVIERLEKEAAVVIFPEGESKTSWELAPLRTGAARIALQGEELLGDQKELLIQPVGITYSDFFRFNSSVTVFFGEPISIREFQAAHSELSSEDLVRALTQEIADHLKEITVDLSHVGNLSLLEMISKLYQSAGEIRDDQKRLSDLRSLIPEMEEKHPMRVKRFEQNLSLHLEMVESLKVAPGERLESRQNRFFMALLLPIVLIGILILVLPYRVCWWISRKITSKRTQHSSWALSLAFILFPSWFLLLGALAYFVSESVRWALMIFFICVGSAYFTSRYFNRFALYLFTIMWPGKKTPVTVLREWRDKLLEDIETW